MDVKTFTLSAGLTLAVAIPASAATVTLDTVLIGADAIAAVDVTAGTDQVGFNLDAIVRTGTVRGVHRTPYDDSSGVVIDGFETLEYFSVGPGNLPSPATMILDAPATSLSFLWGSPDDHNDLVFRKDGSDIAFFDGDLVASFPGVPTLGSVTFVELSVDMAFDEVLFVSTERNAFEFANVSVTPVVPLPAGWPLMIAGLGALGLIGMRKPRA